MSGEPTPKPAPDCKIMCLARSTRRASDAGAYFQTDAVPQRPNAWKQDLGIFQLGGKPPLASGRRPALVG